MYLMDEGTLELLDRVRFRLEDDSSDEDVDTVEEGNFVIGEHALEVLERARLRLESDLEEDELDEGTGQAKNYSDVDEALDMYLDSIVDHLVNEYEADENDAVDLVFSVADELAANGDLPPFPTEESSDDDVALWLGKAKTAGFEHEVLQAAM